MTDHLDGHLKDTYGRDKSSVPDICTQREEIQSINQSRLEGDIWYLVDMEWMNMWMKYVDYKQIDESSAGQQSDYPGPLGLSKQFTGENPIPLSEHLIGGCLYVIVTAQAWNKLVSWYGVADTPQLITKQHSAERKEADGDKCYEEKENLLSLKLCIHPEMNDYVVESFNQADTVVNLEKKVRDIFSTPEGLACRIWHYLDVNTMNLLDSTCSLQESGLCNVQGPQIIVLEKQNKDGTWPLGTSHTSSNAMCSQNSDSSASSSSTYFSSSDAQEFGLCGLINLGNTCYMNSALQCLSNTEPLTEYFRSQTFENHINTDNPLGMGGAVAKTYSELLVHMWSGKCSTCSPLKFKSVVESFAPRFSGHQQQDSQELLTFLLDGLHEDLNLVKDKPYVDMTIESTEREEDVAKEFWYKHLQRNKSIVVRLFQGQLKSAMKCLQCSQVFKTFDPFMFLSLPLPARNTYSIFVVVVRADPREHMVKYQVEVPKGGTVANLKEEISRMTEIKREVFIVVKVSDGQMKHFYSNNDPLTLISDQNSTYIYELNHPITDPNWIHIPIQHDCSTSPRTPTFMTIPRKKCTCRQICQAVFSMCRWYAQSAGEESTEEEKLEEVMQSLASHSTSENTGTPKKKCCNTDAAEVILEDPSCAVSTDHSENIALNDCLDLLTKEKNLGTNNAWFCQQCKGVVEATKKCDIWKLPPVLVIYLTRFTHNRHWRDKLHTFVHFPIKGLDLSKYMMAPEQPKPVYDLFAVTNHMGGMEGGHYTAYCKNKATGKWYCYDDTHVTEISQDSVITANAYVLFYHRCDEGHVTLKRTLSQSFAEEVKRLRHQSCEADHDDGRETGEQEMSGEMKELNKTEAPSAGSGSNRANNESNGNVEEGQGQGGMSSGERMEEQEMGIEQQPSATTDNNEATNDAENMAEEETRNGEQLPTLSETNRATSQPSANVGVSDTSTGEKVKDGKEGEREQSSAASDDNGTTNQPNTKLEDGQSNITEGEQGERAPRDQDPPSLTPAYTQSTQPSPTSDASRTTSQPNGEVEKGKDDMNDNEEMEVDSMDCGDEQQSPPAASEAKGVTNEEEQNDTSEGEKMETEATGDGEEKLTQTML